MPDEGIQTPEVETVETETPETPEEPKLLMGKYKTAEEVVEAFQGYQSSTDKERARSKKIYDQLVGAGYTIDDDATVRVPGRETPKEPKAKDDDAEPDFYDPEAAAKAWRDTQARVNRLERGYDVTTRSVSGMGKTEALRRYSAVAKDDAGKLWDEKIAVLPPEARLDPDTMNAVGKIVFSEVYEKHGQRGLAGGGNETVNRGAGASERPGGETTERTAPAAITADLRKSYEGLGGKAELGKTLEEFAASVEEATGGTE